MKMKSVLLLLVMLMATACSLTPAPAAQKAVQPVVQATKAVQEKAKTQGQDQAQNQPQNQAEAQDQKGGTPPEAAVKACSAKAEQDACEFSSQKGTETGVCEMVEQALACSPKKDQQGQQTDQAQGGSDSNGTKQGQNGGKQGQTDSAKDPAKTQVKPADTKGGPTDGNGAAYNIDQAISDKAQGMTIAYDALAFMTGDLGSDSFFPPGKVADFWGFQYLRDNDPSEMGHAGEFLTSAAMNMLNTLTASQRAELVALATSQVKSINDYGYKRFVLMDAFRRLVNGELPTGTSGLNLEAVKSYSAELYLLDGQISFDRAQLMGKLIGALDAKQKAYLDAMVGKGMLEWPKVEEPTDVRGLDRDVKVAVMTYAADMFSWYAGSVEADVYFCPERHGTYFGSFYLKDIRAMSDPSYSIPTNLTGDLGETMLKLLSAEQSQQITGLVDIQKPALEGIVKTREQVSVELRKFKDGASADNATVMGLMEQYGQLDGEIIYNLAVHFSKVSQSLSTAQKTELTNLRKELLGDMMYAKGAYLYSQAIAMPEIANTDFLFK